MKIVMSPKQYAEVWKLPTEIIDKIILKKIGDSFSGVIKTAKGEVQFEVISGHEGPVQKVIVEELSNGEFMDWMRNA